jgi:hypothetical protein
VSRWLQQQVQPQYPDVQIFEVLSDESGYNQVDEKTCLSWMDTNGVTHPVLRDLVGSGSVTTTLNLQVKDMMVVDRSLKIVYKGQVADGFAYNKVLNTLSQLQ